MKDYKIIPAGLLLFSLLILPSYATRKKIDYRQLLDEFIYVLRYERTLYKDQLASFVPVYGYEKQKVSDAKKERIDAFSIAKKSVGEEIDNFIPNKCGLKPMKNIAKEVFNRSIHINEGVVTFREPGNILEIGGNILLDGGKNFAADIISDVDTSNKFLNGVLKEVGSGIKTSGVMMGDGKIFPRLAYKKSIKDIDCGFVDLGFGGGLIYNNGFQKTSSFGVSKQLGAYNAGIRGSVRFDDMNNIQYSGIDLDITRMDKKATVNSKLSINSKEIKFGLSARF